MIYFFKRWRHTLAYGVLAIIAIVAVTLSWANQQDIREDARQDTIEARKNDARIEELVVAVEREAQRASNENCEGLNSIRLIILDILVGIAERPQEGDVPRDVEERREVLDDLRPLLRLESCPPAPLRNGGG